MLRASNLTDFTNAQQGPQLAKLYNTTKMYRPAFQSTLFLLRIWVPDGGDGDEIW